MSSPTRMAWWCAFTILLSAFLLFQVQPVISKMILPWFGGSPAVWTTCMLFFQLLLLGGYAYAHWMTQGTRPGRQVAIHMLLLGVAILLLPIIPGPHWKPVGAQNPTLRILQLLTMTVGLPYFLLASTGPLVQAWFSRACPGRSPYWLYALSNIGSLAALLSYPFLVEPQWTSHQQGIYWSLGFAVFGIVCGGLGVRVWQRGKVIPAQTWDEAVAEQAERLASTPTLTRRMTWLALPGLGCIALLATTNHVCQDVAVVPFMWVAPLSLYLLSYILAFAGSWAYPRRTTCLCAAIGMLLVVGMQRQAQVTAWLTDHPPWPARLESFQNHLLDLCEPVARNRILPALGLQSFSLHELNESIITHVSIYLFAMFAICLMCHGELARLRPSTHYLTSYFLMSSAGGALGGVFVALVCPVIFLDYLELNWMLTTAFAVVISVWVVNSVERWKAGQGAWKWLSRLSDAAVLLLLPGFLGIVGAQMEARNTHDLDTARSFYGVLHVQEENKDQPEFHGIELLNGRILHGYQLLDDSLRRIPTTYYTRSGGAGLAIEGLRRVEAPAQPDPAADHEMPLISPTPLRIAVVGLGTGTMASYGQQGDRLRFYEINPQVVKFARKHFTFLDDCDADWDIALGDARLSMESEEPQGYHALVLDAFSGDAIPVHLLTKESLEIYLRHMHPRGVIAVHVSNRHIDLIPVVAMLAREFALEARLVANKNSNGSVECPSDWILLTRSEPFLKDREVRRLGQRLTESQSRGPLWTDQYSNLLEILK